MRTLEFGNFTRWCHAREGVKDFVKVKNVTSGHQVMCDIIYGCPLRKDTTPRDISLLSLFCFTRGRVEQRTTKVSSRPAIPTSHCKSRCNDDKTWKTVARQKKRTKEDKKERLKTPIIHRLIFAQSFLFVPRSKTNLITSAKNTRRNLNPEIVYNSWPEIRMKRKKGCGRPLI